jgi:hypothetical protein
MGEGGTGEMGELGEQRRVSVAGTGEMGELGKQLRVSAAAMAICQQNLMEIAALLEYSTACWKSLRLRSVVRPGSKSGQNSL